MTSIVFKVKYDETLRRFNVAINEDQRLDLSIEGLRLKISSLFNFPSDVDFYLTYKDEDGDLVTLADDDDLLDVVSQGLDPLRITVHVKPDQGAQSSSASSTPLPQNGLGTLESFSETLKSMRELENLQKSGTPDVAKILKSVQEPLAQALSKLSLDLSSKATSTSPILVDIFDGLSKMGQAYANAVLPNSGPTSANPHVEVGYESIPNSDVGKHDDMKDVAVKLQPCPAVASDTGKSKSWESISSNMSTSGGVKNKNVSTGKKGAPKNVPSGDALERRLKSYGAPFLLGECPLGGIPPGFPPSNRSLNDVVGSVIHKGITCDGCEAYPITGPRFKSKVRYDYDLCSLCFSKMGNDSDYTRINSPMVYKRPQPVKAPDAADSLAPLLHYGIGCDSCGSFPITGLRFKSKVKNDYDLCSTCFSRMGNDIDYTRIEYPVPFRHPRISMSPGVESPCPYIMRPRSVKQLRPLLKQLRPRLDSRFIVDVNIMDGTTMAPSTPFTKIWRMRNEGTLPWNRGLQLIWIGGDRFRSTDSVQIQVPLSGLNVGLELDIAVDFIAPELPGRYISYWRMAEPSGHKFGQRVWVQIQVDPSVDLTCESSSVPNLNHPDVFEAAFPEVGGVKIEPESGIEVGESNAPVSNLDQNNKIQMSALNFPINDDLLVASDTLNPSSVAESSVSAPAAATLSSLPNVFGESSAASHENRNIEQSYEKSEVEEKLLKELEEMGFKQIDLNKEVLPTNEDDLDQSLDDLSDGSEWDPILEELKEMGFEDKDTNKKLLEKNNGSISRVVMDLIAEEKA